MQGKNSDSMPLVSIVVPVYNVELYVDRCVRSIISQTYKNIDIVLVDDGSTDSSGEKCDHLAASDSRIRVIHQRNLGLPGARQTGVRFARGEYVVFVDSDDWIANELISLCVTKAFKDRSDIVYYDYIRTGDCDDVSVHPARSVFPEFELISGKEAFRGMLTGCLGWNIWRMMIKAAILKDENIVFPTNIMMGEDLALTSQVLGEARTVSFLPLALYYYYNRFDSSVNLVSSSTRNRVMDDLVKAYDYVLAYTRRSHDDLTKLFYAFRVTQYFSYIVDIVVKEETGDVSAQWKKRLTTSIISSYLLSDKSDLKNLLRVLLVVFHILEIRLVAKYFYKRICSKRD